MNCGGEQEIIGRSGRMIEEGRGGGNGKWNLLGRARQDGIYGKKQARR
jgi:hypothetical protein